MGFPSRGDVTSVRLQSLQRLSKQLGEIAPIYSRGHNSYAAENAEPAAGAVLQNQDDEEEYIMDPPYLWFQRRHRNHEHSVRALIGRIGQATQYA